MDRILGIGVGCLGHGGWVDMDIDRNSTFRELCGRVHSSVMLPAQLWKHAGLGSTYCHGAPKV